MVRKHIYRWHRTASLIIAIPILLWAISGFMHPLMTNIKPRLATQSLQPQEVDSHALKTSLQQALQQNSITAFHLARLVHIDTNWFYQVQRKAGDLPVYLSATNGKQLRNGDALYAQYIAKQFLEGQPETVKQPVQYASLNIDPHSMHAEHDEAASPSHDCCDAATACVLLNDKGSKAMGITLVIAFDGEYKPVNRLLPVYKVYFSRPDGIRVYVETTMDRFAFAMDNRRAWFDTIFGMFHTWEWLNALGGFKYMMMGMITLTALLTTIMGLYIFFITKTKKGNQPLARSRRWHRYVSLTASLFTLMFTFSGGLHALDKLRSAPAVSQEVSHEIPAGILSFSFTQIKQAIGNQPLYNYSPVMIGNDLYWRVLTRSPSQKAVAPVYIRNSSYAVLDNGDERYARTIAGRLSGHQPGEVLQTEMITKFTEEYGFINKRLPVWKVAYASNAHERYYVETGSGKLAAYINDRDLFEGYSFALLHKHHYMDWGGKATRDVSTMVAAALQIAMVTVGLLLFFRWRAKRIKRDKKDATIST